MNDSLNRADQSIESINVDGDASAMLKEKVLPFQSRPEAGAEKLPPPERRDWSAAIDLVNEAAEAVRLAQERTLESENFAKQLVTNHKEQMKAAEARVASAEKRTEAALARATEAEGWLNRFYDAISSGFNLQSK